MKLLLLLLSIILFSFTISCGSGSVAGGIEEGNNSISLVGVAFAVDTQKSDGDTAILSSITLEDTTQYLEKRVTNNGEYRFDSLPKGEYKLTLKGVNGTLFYSEKLYLDIGSIEPRVDTLAQLGTIKITYASTLLDQLPSGDVVSIDGVDYRRVLEVGDSIVFLDALPAGGSPECNSTGFSEIIGPLLHQNEIEIIVGDTVEWYVGDLW